MGVHNFHSYSGKNWTGSRNIDTREEMTWHLAGEPILVLPLSKWCNKVGECLIQWTLFKLLICTMCARHKSCGGKWHHLMWNPPKVWEILTSNVMKLDIEVNTTAVGRSKISTPSYLTMLTWTTSQTHQWLFLPTNSSSYHFIPSIWSFLSFNRSFRGGSSVASLFGSIHSSYIGWWCHFST